LHVCNTPIDAYLSCFTNHALDQFLEHLLDVTQKLVRIGSRSKSAILEDYNLQTLIRNQKKLLRTRLEKSTECRLHQTLKELSDEGTGLCETLAQGHGKIKWHQIADLLRRDFPRHYQQLSSDTDDEGFQQVGAIGGSYFDYWIKARDIQNRKDFEILCGGAQSQAVEAREHGITAILDTQDVWDLSKRERVTLVNYWGNLLHQEWIDKLVALAQGHSRTVIELDSLRSEYSARVLETADVVGLTTTGLARNSSLLGRVKPKTLICEEAGEVLEVCSFVYYIRVILISGTYADCPSP
jgi:hypothetical protein